MTAPKPSNEDQSLGAAPRVWIDRSVCIGGGNCTRLAPGAFALDTELVATVADASSVPSDRLRLAERSCPTGAIFVEGP